LRDTSQEQEQHSSSLTTSAQSKVGALLVHGLNGNTHDMDELEMLLQAHGVIVENILLPGHGSDVRDMLPLGWPEWSAAVRCEFYALKERCDHVFLIGHSLGGALCLHIAAHEDVAGVVAICAPLHMRPWLRSAVQFAQHITPFVPTLREDIRDPVARRKYASDVYRWTPMAPVANMLKHLPLLRHELPRMCVPALVIAAKHDHVVPVSDGYEIYRLLGSQEKRLIILHHSYHVAMKDHDKETVFASTLAFVQKYMHGAQIQDAGFDEVQQDKMA
jgi:carboxylesterase